MNEIILVCDDLFGLEVYTVMEQVNRWDREHGNEPRYRILGYISDSEAPFGNFKSSMKRLGGIQDWKPTGDEQYALGIRMPERKRAVVEQLKANGCTFCTVVSPWIIGSITELEEGSVVCAYSMKVGLHIGKYTTILNPMMGAFAKNIGDYSTILHFSNIIGDIGENTYVGNHVFLSSCKNIGDNCYVEDGSIIVKNVKSGTRVSGVPARKMKAN